MDWRNEIIELHAFFQSWFLGEAASIDRLETVLASDFSMVGPHGDLADRASTIAAVQEAYGHAATLGITTSDHTLHREDPAFLVAGYVESHQLADRSNHRLSTVVFVPEPSTPNGVSWVRVHETFIGRTAG